VKLGKVNVDREILGSLSLDQLLEWQVFSELEPFDEVRMDLRFASVVEAVLNVFRDSKKKPIPYRLKDTVLYFGDSRRVEEKAGIKAALPWQQLKAKAKAIAGFFNARFDKADRKKRRREERLAQHAARGPRPEARPYRRVRKGGGKVITGGQP
jgi:hypothetical protein